MSEEDIESSPIIPEKPTTSANIISNRPEQRITDVVPDKNGVYRPKVEVPQTPKERIAETKSSLEKARGITRPDEPIPDILHAQVGPNGKTEFIPPPILPNQSLQVERPVQEPVPEESSLPRMVVLSRIEQMQQGLKRMRGRMRR